LTVIPNVELALGMELTLNLGWVLVALWMLFAWLRVAPRSAKERRAQFVALAVVILILLPAISMTDDLIAAQNPAEVDCCSVRRDYNWAHAHLNLPVPAALPLPSFAGLNDRLTQMRAPDEAASWHPVNRSLGPIQNRPPPAA
jgi:hypothetical protein